MIIFFIIMYRRDKEMIKNERSTIKRCDIFESHREKKAKERTKLIAAVGANKKRDVCLHPEKKGHVAE